MARGGLTLPSITIAALLGTALLAQNPPTRASKDARRAVPKTPWGHPDLQGIWDQTTGTPLERPDEYKGRTSLTDAEAAQREKRRFAEFDEDGRAGGTGDYGSVWREQSKNALNRTALITDPADGRVPALTAAGQKISRREPWRGAAGAKPTRGTIARSGSAASRVAHRESPTTTTATGTSCRPSTRSSSCRK